MPVCAIIDRTLSRECLSGFTGENMKGWSLAKKLYRDRRVRFLFVGCLNTAVGTGSDLLLRYLGLHYALSSALGTMIGTVHSYFWNKYFTYSQKRNPGGKPGVLCSSMPPFMRSAYRFSIF